MHPATSSQGERGRQAQPWHYAGPGVGPTSHVAGWVLLLHGASVCPALGFRDSCTPAHLGVLFLLLF